MSIKVKSFAVVAPSLMNEVLINLGLLSGVGPEESLGSKTPIQQHVRLNPIIIYCQKRSINSSRSTACLPFLYKKHEPSA